MRHEFGSTTLFIPVQLSEIVRSMILLQAFIDGTLTKVLLLLVLPPLAGGKTGSSKTLRPRSSQPSLLSVYR